jgi:hypothetical protein
MARDVTPSLGTALDRLSHSAQRVVGVVAELKQFETLVASGRGAVVPPAPGIKTLIKTL